MAVLLANALPFLFYWLVLFVACFAVVEYGQTYFYETTTPSAGLKVAVGSAILAGLLTWTRSTFDKMFTEDILYTVILLVAAFVVFTLIFRFHPQHAAAIGIVTMLLVSGLATMGVDSMMNRNRAATTELKPPSKPIRKGVGGAQPLIPAAEPEAKKK